MPRSTILIGTAALFVVLAGCTTSANGTPTPDTEQTTPPSSEGETDGAPPVTDPIDASQFVADPCATLTPTQQADLGFSKTGEPDLEDDAGPGCQWFSDDSSIGVTFLTPNKKGLSNTYWGRENFEVFEPTSVTGYPAVHALEFDTRAAGTCGVTVGISETLAFFTLEQGQLGAEGSCARAKEAAAAVIATLKAGS